MTSNVAHIYDDGSAEMKNGLIRKNYSCKHRDINSLSDLKATLRSGALTDLGGYPTYFITNDGCAWSHHGVRAEWRTIARDWITGLGPRPVACNINWEDSELTCELTNERIVSAYAD
jgi:hypothetical protein